MAFRFPRQSRPAEQAPPPVSTEGGPAPKRDRHAPADEADPSRAAARRPLPRTLAEAIRLRRPGHGA